ncbi:hypothetical protein [Candidatus Pyrohabitans sp.]
MRLRNAFLYGVCGAGLYVGGFWLYEIGIHEVIAALIGAAGAVILYYGWHKVMKAEEKAKVEV